MPFDLFKGSTTSRRARTHARTVIIADPRASIVDLELTRVIDGDLVKIMSWYDNEWGYANQMLRQARSVGS